MAAPKHIGWIETQYDPKLAESLRAMQSQIDLVAQKAGLSGPATQAPPNIRSISVTAADGYFEIAITDPEGASQPSLGIHYFLEYDTTSAFSNAKTIDNGPSRNAREALGNQTLFWRAYSQYRNSPRSTAIVYGGSSPIGVAGGGSAGPTLGTSQGSGGDGGGGGFGGGV